MFVRFVLVVSALAGCTSNPEDVAFDSTSGTGGGTGGCICSYDDGSQGDPMSIEITCTEGNTFSGVSFFVDPTTPGVDQSALLIFTPSDVPANYKAGAIGQSGTLGPEKRGGGDKIIRSIDGLEFHWDEQDACNAAQGCVDTYHLKAGAVSGGGGGCEDFWASVDQATS
ncbi:MAG TPA: hypothetical protein VGM39_04590 [Kofleriaceae bacterium]|jgi:hypothetical protein